MNQVSGRKREPRTPSTSTMLGRLEKTILRRVEETLGRSALGNISITPNAANRSLRWSCSYNCIDLQRRVEAAIKKAVGSDFRRAEFSPEDTQLVVLTIPTRD